MSSDTLNISKAKYYLVIFLDRGRIYFMPCRMLTITAFDTGLESTFSLIINDTCIVNGSKDKVLSIGDKSVHDYIEKTGDESCVFVDHIIDKMYLASTANLAQSEKRIIQLFVEFAISKAIQNSGIHEDVAMEALENWIFAFISPVTWGKTVDSKAFFSVFDDTKLIKASNSLFMFWFEAFLLNYLHTTYLEEVSAVYLESKNILCEIIADDEGNASLIMNIFSVTRTKMLDQQLQFMTIDPSSTIPSLFSNKRIGLNASYTNLTRLFQDSVKDKIGLTQLFYKELIRMLCSYLYVVQGVIAKNLESNTSIDLSKMLPFENSNFHPTLEEEVIANLRALTLQDILSSISSYLEPIISEIQPLIDEEVAVIRILFCPIPANSHLYEDHMEYTLFVVIKLILLKMESKNIKKFNFIHSRFWSYYSEDVIVKEDVLKLYALNTCVGMSFKVWEKLRSHYNMSSSLSTLKKVPNAHKINMINYVYLSANEVLMQSIDVDDHGKTAKVSPQKSNIVTLEDLSTVRILKSATEEPMIDFYLSKSAITLLESQFPVVMNEFEMLYRRKADDNVTQELFTDEHGPTAYKNVVTTLCQYQAEYNSSLVHVTQRKHIGTLLVIYFGYLKELMFNEFGTDKDTMACIMIFEQTIMSTIISYKDDRLLKKILHMCGWIPETGSNKRKLIVYSKEDNSPIADFLQKAEIKHIPAKSYFYNITMTKDYVKQAFYQVLEDVSDTNQHYTSIKCEESTATIDFYNLVCENIWQLVVESAYEIDSLLKYPANINIADIEFTLEAFESFKMAFYEYMTTTFPLTYASHPYRKHMFQMGNSQPNCYIVLTNVLVYYKGVISALKSMCDLSIQYCNRASYILCTPTNFDNVKSSSAPMLKLVETGLNTIIEEYYKPRYISKKGLILIHVPPKLNSVVGDSAFGYKALTAGVVRAIEDITFAISFTYHENDTPALVQAINGPSSAPQLIEKGYACIISKQGAPTDNYDPLFPFKKIVFKLPRLEDIESLTLIQIDEAFEGYTGEIISLSRTNYAVLTTFYIQDIFIQPNDKEKFSTYPYIHYFFNYDLPGYIDNIEFYSDALSCTLVKQSFVRPIHVGYFDSYEQK